MANIIIGTTPTIKYKFSSVKVSDMISAFLTIKRRDKVLLKKSLSEADVSTTSLSWHLSQEETLAIGIGDTRIMCNTLLVDGTRTASAETDVKFINNHIPEVI